MNWRAIKKYLRNKTAGLQRHGYFEDCNYHPCRMTRLNPYRSSQPWTRYDSDVDGVSLISGKGTSCSLYNCNALPLTEKEALERQDYAKHHGELAYLLHYVYINATAEQVEELKAWHREWRNEELI